MQQLYTEQQRVAGLFLSLNDSQPILGNRYGNAFRQAYCETVICRIYQRLLRFYYDTPELTLSDVNEEMSDLQE